MGKPALLAHNSRLITQLLLLTESKMSCDDNDYFGAQRMRSIMSCNRNELENPSEIPQEKFGTIDTKFPTQLEASKKTKLQILYFSK